ncbi:MAG: hypothetical protein NWF00_01600 [Candidatus Bathyarchaeota archaeon]|nr:hypothetical protein [Candidatus Bathyarchaeota archaeon]
MAMQDEFPKCPVCGSTVGYEYSGMISKYAKCYSCLARWKLYFENQILTALVLHELPKNGAALHKVANANIPLFAEIGVPLGLIFWKTLQLNEKIDWDYLKRSIDKNILRHVPLENGEAAIYCWIGTRTTQNTKTEHDNSEKQSTQSGALMLTTRRLIWLNRHQNSTYKQTFSYKATHEIALESVTGISGETGDSSNWIFPKKTSIVDNSGESLFTLQYAFLELFKPMIEDAIHTRKTEIENEQETDKGQLTLDFPALKTTLERGGLVMQVLKCPQCRTTLEFPKSGNQTQCAHCGKTINAHDVLEKVKSILRNTRQA